MSAGRDHHNILFRDVYGITLVLFIGLVAIMATLMKAEQASAGIPPKEAISAAISWTDGDSDVDLWVNGPGEPVPVGYSNKGGVLWNLLRDDLGKFPDALPANFEDASTRGILAGAYRVNVQCFRCPSLPITVAVEMRIRGKVFATSSVTLRKDHEEKTALAFDIDTKGEVIASSMNTVFQPLRSGSGK